MGLLDSCSFLGSHKGGWPHMPSSLTEMERKMQDWVGGGWKGIGEWSGHPAQDQGHLGCMLCKRSQSKNCPAGCWEEDT